MPQESGRRRCVDEIGEHVRKRAKYSSNEDEASLRQDGAATTISKMVGSQQTVPNMIESPTNPFHETRSPTETACDTCFGLLLIKASHIGNTPVPSQCTPINLDFKSNFVRVLLEDSDTCVAIFDSLFLYRLVNDAAVTLSATICGKPQRVFDEMPSREDCSLRIVVYGILKQKDLVADILSKGDLFLQHPSPTEFDRSFKYMNPQYLLPPGEELPDIEKLPVYTCCKKRDGPRKEILQERDQNEILKIFNTAYDSNTSMTLIEPSPRLATQLKKHQIEALTMMVEKEAGAYDHLQFPSIWRPFSGPKGDVRYQNIVTKKYSMTPPPPIRGGILADEMGLGKTLSMLALICHSLDTRDRIRYSSDEGPSRATIIIAPKSTIYGWQKQIITHIQTDKVRLLTYYGPKRHEQSQELDNYDIILTTYETLRSDRHRSDRHRGSSPLFNQEWSRIVLDEAHRIRNRSSRTFSDVCKVWAASRWCLTGTPIQNYLEDFGALLAFVKVPPLHTEASFASYLGEPVKKRQNAGFQLLRKVVAATCLRRTKDTHASILNLPRKTQLIERVELKPDDRRLYEFFKRFSYSSVGLDKTTRRKSTTNILILISILRLICDHGEALLPESALTAWKGRDRNALSWEMLESTLKRCVLCNYQIEEFDSAESVSETLGCGHVVCSDCIANSDSSSSQLSCPKCLKASPPTTDTSGLKPRYPPSPKIEALLRNLLERREGQQFAKSVVFSYWTKMLDLIGAALEDRKFKFCRLDGQSTMAKRKKALETFSNDPGCSIMLASIGAAGEGIDLTAATSVHIIEPHWNPMVEAQAIDRVHRIGQQKDVEVIRYIVDDSIETYVRWVQEDKKRLIADSFSTSEVKTDDVDEIRWKKLLEYLE